MCRKLICMMMTLFLAIACQDIEQSADSVQPEAVKIIQLTAEPTATQPPPTMTPLPQGKAGSAGYGDPLFDNLGNGGYDVQHYDLQISWDNETGEIQGVATITALATQNLSGFNFDLKALTVESVTVNGETVAHGRENKELIITLPEEMVLIEGDQFETVVTYQGVPKPVSDGGFPLGWIKYETGVYIVSEPNGSHSWYPVNDHPADKATYTLRITVPKPFVVAANGTPSTPIEDGELITYIFDEDELMASYLVTVNIAEFEVQSEPGDKSGIPIKNYIEKGVRPELSDAFKNQDEILSVLIDLFGPYPYDEIGGVVPNSNLRFALETQTLPIYGQGILMYAGDFVIVHELAHQWFGNSLSPATWDEIWLNEGFANYSEALWLEHTDGREAMLGYMQTQYEEEKPQTVPPGIIESGGFGTLFSGSVYQRGGLTLHALRLTVGDDAFFEILQTYASRYAHSNVTTEDFISVAEEVSGQSLTELFDAWLYQAELPELPEG